MCVVSLPLVLGPVWLTDVAFAFKFAFDGIIHFSSFCWEEARSYVYDLDAIVSLAGCSGL